MRSPFYTFENLSSREIAEMVLSETSDSDIALFYLLRYRMHSVFLSRYSQFHLDEDFGDTLMDFYLYLRGIDDDHPYKMLKDIRNFDSIESWILQTFRHFLVRKQNLQDREKEKIDIVIDKDLSTSRLDRQIMIIAKTMVWIDDKLSELDQFVFFRSLLSSLQCSMVKNDKMAEALGLTYTNYRSRNSRIKAKVMERIKYLKRSSYNDDEYDYCSSELYMDIIANYENFTSIVQCLYESVLEKLDVKKDIENIRRADESSNEIMWMLASEEEMELDHLYRHGNFDERKVILFASFHMLNLRSKLWDDFLRNLS